MKPRELYSGNAPQAMAMMGYGLPEVGANIARSIQSGYSALGQGLAQGITSAAGSVANAYTDYKKMSSSTKASEGFYKDMKDSGYLSPEISQNIDAKINSDEFKHSSTADKAAYWDNIKSFMGQSIAQKNSIDKILAMSPEERNLKTAQAKEAEARAAALGRKVNPPPMLDFTSGVDWNSQVDLGISGKATAQPAAAEMSAAPRKLDYENLSSEQKKLIDDSSFGKDYWNVLGEDQQAKFLPSLHLPNFGLKKSTR